MRRFAFLSQLDLAACRLTLPGRCALYAAAVMILVGLYKGINLLVLVGYAVPVLLLAHAAATRAVGELRAVRRLPRPVFAGAAFEVEVRLENAGADPVAAGRVEDHGPGHALAWQVADLGAGQSRVLRARTALPRRGRYAWGPVAVASAAPFGLVERRAELAPGEEMIVLPRLGLLDREQFLRRVVGRAEADAERARAHPQRHPTARAEFHGLRPFRTGDSPRAVHWRTSARRGELMVREYEDFTGENLVVVFDAGLPEGSNDDGEALSRNGAAIHPSSGTLHPSFEAAVSLAATICWEWCRRRGDRLVLACAGLQPAVFDSVTGPDLGRRVLEHLAVIGPGPAGDPAALAGALNARSLPAGPVVVVAAGPSALADALREALRRPVTLLDASGRLDFYEPPTPGAAARRGAR